MSKESFSLREVCLAEFWGVILLLFFPPWTCKRAGALTCAPLVFSPLSADNRIRETSDTNLRKRLFISCRSIYDLEESLILTIHKIVGSRVGDYPGEIQVFGTNSGKFRIGTCFLLCCFLAMFLSAGQLKQQFGWPRGAFIAIPE